MQSHFQKDLAELKEKLLTMASLAGNSVRNSIKALVDRDDDLARQVQEDDDKLDQLEIEIDEQSIVLLSHAPLASDLRFITMAMKLSHALERVGDESTTIARRSLELSQEPQLKPYVDIPRMAAIALEMLRAGIHAFVASDPAEARAVIPRDAEVDAINKQLHRELASYMVEKPNTITRCLHLMTISKSIERIADHATNIAEEVVYVQEGRDIRHQVRKATPPAGPA
jgi:phosphate transport system protein